MRIAAGDLVLVSLTGASRDPRTSTADAFDPTSPSAAHLAFGHGMHRCVGAELARMELRAALRGLARRFPDLALAVDPGTLAFTPLSAVYGLESLPVRLDAAVGGGRGPPERAAQRARATRPSSHTGPSDS